MSHRLVPLLGGTFDPIHHGHLRCALEIAEWTGSAVRLLPSAQPMHRDQPGATAGQRVDMLQLAIENHRCLVLDDREVRRGGATYSIDTLGAMRAEDPDAAYCFIVGADAFAGLHRWRAWQALVALTHFIVVTRPGHRLRLPPPLAEWARQARCDGLAALRADQAGRVIEREITALEISATAIRHAVASGHDPAFLVPEAVRDYIVERGLYRA